MQHEDLVRKVEKWWTTRNAPMMELVGGPISFLPIPLTHQVELPVLQDQRHRVSMAADRKFYQTVVMEPVCLPDENDPLAYSVGNNFGLDLVKHQTGLRR